MGSIVLIVKREMTDNVEEPEGAVANPLPGVTGAFNKYATQKTIGLAGVGLAQIENNVLSIKQMFVAIDSEDIDESQKAAAYSVIVFAIISALLCLVMAILVALVGKTKLHKDAPEKVARAEKMNKAKMWIGSIIGGINTLIFIIQLNVFAGSNQ